MIHKKLQQQLYSKLRDRYLTQNPNPTGASKLNPSATSYAQAVKQQPNPLQNPSSHTHLTPISTSQTTMTHPPNNTSELQKMMKNIMDQMSTLINLISMLVTKHTNG